MTAPLPQPLPLGDDVPVVVLVSASWAGPSRPAPTVLRELGRRWGTAALTLLVEDPSEEVLDDLRIEVVPTWLRFVRASSDVEEGSGTDEQSSQHDSEPSAAHVLPSLEGQSPDGRPVRVEGPLRLTHRLEGAQPKHVVADVLGPSPRP